MKFIELKSFKNENKIDFIDWNKPAIKANGLWYKLKNINVGGTNYPYVCVPDKVKKPIKLNLRDIKFSEEVKNKIHEVNKNKSELKYTSFLIENDEYFITGIGDKSIRAYKNNDIEEKYFWYYTKEGSKILNHLYNKIGQSVLI